MKDYQVIRSFSVKGEVNTDIVIIRAESELEALRQVNNWNRVGLISNGVQYTYVLNTSGMRVVYPN